MSISVSFTKSTLIVLEKLRTDGPMCPAELAKESGLAMRTVTLALKTLQSNHLCRKVPNLSDMRKPLYHADHAKVRELQRNIEIWRSMANIQVPR
ncbi:MarR family transcriptional regulator [Candidatus Thorarchaeota archaeon]|nr:MAG: MarR family transcriptional regulator [Candidatus Thorarchaeota archaeon]